MIAKALWKFSKGNDFLKQFCKKKQSDLQRFAHTGGIRESLTTLLLLPK